MVNEAMLEAKRAEFQMLTLLTNPTIKEDGQWSTWKKSVEGIWSTYIGMLFNEPIVTQEEKDKDLVEYYNNIVRKSKIQMYKDKETGNLRLKGLETLLPSK